MSDQVSRSAKMVRVHVAKVNVLHDGKEWHVRMRRDGVLVRQKHARKESARMIPLGYLIDTVLGQKVMML